jgi:flagellar hook-basal body complex protein FliE
MKNIDTVINANSAYKKALTADITKFGSDNKITPGSHFASVLKNKIAEPFNEVLQAEKITFDGMNEKKDMTSIVTAVNRASITLKEISMITRRVIAAYQEIMRMQL